MNKNRLSFSQQGHARPARNRHFHSQRRLKDLLKQFPLVNAGGRTDAQALPFLQKHDLVSVFADEIEFVGYDNHGVAIYRHQVAQGIEQIDLGSDVEMEGRFIEEQESGLLGERTSENHALFFAAGDLVHPAFDEMRCANLGKRVLGDVDVFLGFEVQAAVVGMPTLQDKFPRARWEEQAAFLLHECDALRPDFGGKRVRGEPV